MASDERSPAERYRDSANNRRFPRTERFSAGVSFPLDEFQVDACRTMESGHGVLVCAPTGAGKTIVGEFAVYLALAEGRKCFYTTPIKALSNQKFNDLCDEHGEDQVGLLTGDTVINGEAPIVVMTTEVLRNMIYAGSYTLNNLGYVVMDEVHYLADRFRGAVWEEIMIELPPSVTVVSLSATVSNAEEFGAWLDSVRPVTKTVVSETRPVPLSQHMLVGNTLLDLFDDSQANRLNPGLTKKIARQQEREWRQHRRRRHVDRARVVERLDRSDLLPAIYFIFSRVGCDAAVEECVRSGIQLTTPSEAQAIRDYATAATAHIEPGDLHAVGFKRWVDGLAAGFAAHHAGLLPVFKEVVEALFERGEVKVVFATETLALGINMPARTVVLERLIKYDGTDHVMLTPGQYTQLTGRAGRRGIDVEGHAVTLWSPDIAPKQVAGLATKRTYPLDSSFAPSYNMAVNLIATAGLKRADAVLASSFAQYQSDAHAVHIAEKARALGRKVDQEAAGAECEKGDFLSYFELTKELSRLERAAQKKRKGQLRDAMKADMSGLKRGDIVWLGAGRRSGWAVYLEHTRPRRNRGAEAIFLTTDGRATAYALKRLTDVLVNGRMRVRKGFRRSNVDDRNELAAALREETSDKPRPTRRAGKSHDPKIDGLRKEIKRHPCHNCPDTGQHSYHASRWWKLRSERQNLQRKAQKRENSLARQFTNVRSVLMELDYLNVTGEGDVTVTDRGRLLRNLFNEADLLVAQCLHDGVWEGLEPPALAALASTVMYESRFEEEDFYVAAPGIIEEPLAATLRRYDTISRLERARGLELTSRPQRGIAWPMYRWASGEDLADALRSFEGPKAMPGGDFVRWTRRTLDLLHQVGEAARTIETDSAQKLAKSAFDAVDAMKRGVVADL
ncbi:DEAD/DEAH box helicase [Haloglycomyces albus]|uniref:DEAD/DEAH box helicase n=1 Tax=Haloglycomyces albus TaxID=526067 RepID=UPI00046D6CA1|nr:DEAD/DEAH box helicase [Haloglycomyces albus]